MIWSTLGQSLGKCLFFSFWYVSNVFVFSKYISSILLPCVFDVFPEYRTVGECKKKKQKPKRFKYLRCARCKEQRLKWRPAAGYRCLGAEQGVNEKSQEMEFK